MYFFDLLDRHSRGLANEDNQAEQKAWLNIRPALHTVLEQGFGSFEFGFIRNFVFVMPKASMLSKFTKTLDFYSPKSFFKETGPRVPGGRFNIMVSPTTNKGCIGGSARNTFRTALEQVFRDIRTRA